MAEVGCSPSSRASNLPLLLGKRNKFLTFLTDSTRCSEFTDVWIQQQPQKKKKARDAKSLNSSLLPCSGHGQGCKHKAGALSWLLPCSAASMGIRGSQGPHRPALVILLSKMHYSFYKVTAYSPLQLLRLHLWQSFG